MLGCVCVFLMIICCAHRLMCHGVDVALAWREVDWVVLKCPTCLMECTCLIWVKEGGLLASEGRVCVCVCVCVYVHVHAYAPACVPVHK